jgi:hypothetical protein
MKTRTKVALSAPVVAGLLGGGLVLGTVFNAPPAHACDMPAPGGGITSCDPPPGAPGGPPRPMPGFHSGVGGNYGTCDYFPNNPICRIFQR